MRTAVLAALTTISLLAACRQGAGQPADSSAANSTAGGAKTATPAANASKPVSAEQAQKLFHERHEGMEKIGKANKTIRAALESGAPDLASIRSSAETISDLASKSQGWFPAGTGHEVLPKTRALPAIWQKPDDFAAKDREFSQAAHALKSAAASGDVGAIKSSFARLGKSCKACHDSYRAEEHPK